MVGHIMSANLGALFIYKTGRVVWVHHLLLELFRPVSTYYQEPWRPVSQDRSRQDCHTDGLADYVGEAIFSSCASVVDEGVYLKTNKFSSSFTSLLYIAINKIFCQNSRQNAQPQTNIKHQFQMLQIPCHGNFGNPPKFNQEIHLHISYVSNISFL